MFQSFQNPSHKPFIKERIAELRSLFDTYQIDGYFVPRSDEYGNEYLPECYERLRFISGFTGSWGLALILRNKAILFVDSRYIIQAPKETHTEIFDCVCVSDMPLKDYFQQQNYHNLVIGYDDALHTQSEINRFTEYLSLSTLKVIQGNLIDKLTQDNKPALPNSKIIVHPLEYAGKTTLDKMADITETLKNYGAESAITTLPESLCWLLNIRGSDVPHTPYVLSYGIIYQTGHLDWFVGKDRITDAIRNHLPHCIKIFERHDFDETLKNLSGIVLIDNENSPVKILNSLQNNSKITKIIDKPDPCLLPKAIKNATEIEATINAHIRDGVAVTRFSCWLKQHYKNNITEIDCVKQLETLRQETGLLKDISFDTIAGTGANGAIVHYRVSNDSNQILREGDLFLLDSGGQYLDGTTDITRTFALGKPTDEMKTRYTQVLKGHLAIAMAKFPEKTTGASLDILARLPLWQAGIDYGHGTGHGVGLYLSVHEGPQSISPKSKIELKAGMILSNEPGYYKKGAFGIRIENLELVTPAMIIEGGEKQMMGFKTLTLVPYERDLIDITLLTHNEINHINQYHTYISNMLMPLMTNQTEKQFLQESCRGL